VRRDAYIGQARTKFCALTSVRPQNCSSSGKIASMRSQSQAFQKDAARIAELAGYFLILGPEHSGCLTDTKDLIRELRAFLTRWDGQLAHFSDQATVETFRRQLHGMERHVEGLYLASLHELVEARREWKLAETFLEAAVALNELIKVTPAHLLPELEAALRGKGPEAYDAARSFRAAMTEADEYEVAYRRLRREFEADWSERLNDPLFQSIDAGDVTTARPLIEAAAEKIAA